MKRTSAAAVSRILNCAKLRVSSVSQVPFGGVAVDSPETQHALSVALHPSYTVREVRPGCGAFYVELSWWGRQA